MKQYFLRLSTSSQSIIKLLKLGLFIGCLLLNAINMLQPINAQPTTLTNIVDVLVNDFYKDKQPKYATVVGIIDGDYQFVFPYGQLSDTDTTLADAQTIFHVGSIAKVFTSSIFVAMVADSLLQPTDIITKFLPDSLAAANPYLHKISLHQLATHTSGLPKTPYNIPQTLTEKDNPYANYQTTDLYHFLMTYQPTTPHQKVKNKTTNQLSSAYEFNYSHLGMGLLGHIMEQQSGKSLEVLLQEYINQPLQLNHTSISYNYQNNKKPIKDTLLNNQPTLAIGHHFGGREAETLSYASLQGAESLYSNVNDLMAFLRANIDETQPIHTILASGHRAYYPTQMRYVKAAYGWFAISKGKKDKRPTVMTHSGRTGGYSNYIAFDKTKKVGVVVLSNSAHRVDELGIALLQVLIP